MLLKLSSATEQLVALGWQSAGLLAVILSGRVDTIRFHNQ
jgi:hypothetical protein